MEQEQLEALLGRTLTTEEVANLDLYLDIATERAESLLCSSITGDEGSGEEPESRRYEAREGYSTVFTDIFTEVVSVTDENGDTVDSDDYEVMQFDKYNGRWYNSLVFKRRFTCNTTITVVGQYGFTDLPNDLALLLARLFSAVSDENSTNSNVKSQRIDDASVTFADSTLEEQFYSDNKSVIQKYSVCNVGMIRHGKVCYHGHRYCHECI